MNSRVLRSCRLFYVSYPQIWRSVTAKLQQIDYKSLNIPIKEIKNWRSATAELQIQQSPIIESPEEYLIPSELLLSRLSYTHFVELLRAKEPLERLFYEVEAIKNNWSVKELERAFDLGLYVRTGVRLINDESAGKFIECRHHQRQQASAGNQTVIPFAKFIEESIGHHRSLSPFFINLRGFNFQ